MCDKQIFENVNQKSFTFIWQSFCARCGSRGGSCRIEREREREGGMGKVGGSGWHILVPDKIEKHFVY